MSEYMHYAVCHVYCTRRHPTAWWVRQPCISELAADRSVETTTRYCAWHELQQNGPKGTEASQADSRL